MSAGPEGGGVVSGTRIVYALCVTSKGSLQRRKTKSYVGKKGKNEEIKDNQSKEVMTAKNVLRNSCRSLAVLAQHHLLLRLLL